MPNTYATYQDFVRSGRYNISDDTTGDERKSILAYLEGSARQVDHICGRHFGTFLQTRTFDGGGKVRLLVPDLIAITTLKTDPNRDRTFETTWATTDYYLGPNNADPQTEYNQESRPYTSIEVDVYSGAQDIFPAGRQTVEIVGKWGFWEHLIDPASGSGNAVNNTAGITASATSIKVDTILDFEVGMTVLIGTEQLFISDRDTGAASAITVTRGVNGTTAAAIADDAAILIYEYPEIVREVCLREAGRAWRTKDATQTKQQGQPRTGQVAVQGGFTKESILDLYPLKRFALGVIGG